MGAELLRVEDLHVEFVTRDGTAQAVNGVSFFVNPGETVAVLGESGSGKSVTAQAIMGILDTPPARIAGGSIQLLGQELVGLAEGGALNIVRRAALILAGIEIPVMTYQTYGFERHTN